MECIKYYRNIESVSFLHITISNLIKNMIFIKSVLILKLITSIDAQRLYSRIEKLKFSLILFWSLSYFYRQCIQVLKSFRFKDLRNFKAVKLQQILLLRHLWIRSLKKYFHRSKWKKLEHFSRNVYELSYR